MLSRLCLLLLMFGFLTPVSAQIRDSLLWVTNGLPVENRPNLNRYEGIKWVGSELQASQVRKFVEMRPASPYDWNGRIIYLLHKDYRGQTFDAPALNLRSRKAAVYVLDCDSRAEILRGVRRLVPPAGCTLVPYEEGMSLAHRWLIVIPKY